MNYKEIKKYIKDNPKAKIVIGCDSQLYKKKFKFVTAVVVYSNEKSKIFYDVSVEKITDTKKSRPFTRLMKETEKAVNTAQELMDVILDRDFEIHLDINNSKAYGSNCVLSTAVGYVWGVIGIEPVIKPDSWGASCVADHIVKGKIKIAKN